MVQINCEDTGNIPYVLNPDDEFRVTFDISSWLNTDTIASVAYSATDEDLNDATTDVLDAANNTNTTTVIKPYVTGGTSGKNYCIKMLVTTAAGDEKAFFIRFYCLEKKTYY
jgi:hypothetical protein